MAASDALHARCAGCGFEAPGDDAAWERAEHPPIGTVKRCPECGSTDVHARR